MKVEVLYVADCPSHPAAINMLREVLSAEGVKADITEVLVADEGMASELEFRGSPTIRINGQDVAGDPLRTGAFALCCRLYPGAKQMGLPPAETVRRAVIEARERGRARL